MTQLYDSLGHKDHVIWDWNGTLLSDVDHSLAVMNRLLGEAALPAIDLARHRREFKFPVSEYYESLGFDVAPAIFGPLCERYTRLFHDGLDRCALWPGARELLTTIKASGRRQSLLSLTQHDLLLKNVDHYGVTHLFDFVVGHVDTRAASKIERGFELMARIQSDPERTVLIGDTDHDLEVGEALGVAVILVDHGHQCPTRLRARHHHVVSLF